MDSTVAVFVPHHLKLDRTTRVDLVVFFHGYSTTVRQALRQHRLREQFVASNRNAVLLIPQLAKNSETSHPGKLDKAGGFNAMIDEAINETEAIKTAIGPHGGIGRVILAAHSAGYHALARSLQRGGLPVSEVYLFDAMFGFHQVYVDWIEKSRGRFLAWLGQVPGSKKWTGWLKGTLAERAIPYGLADAKRLRDKDLIGNRILLVENVPYHGAVVRSRKAFQRALATSALNSTVNPESP